ncbi:unnamed protein product [Lactuca virosa]|uniref:Uncharacterized protein n=1 Tax=Lactuca virosa TaxID=75947 RepID=A0AAU9N704_9ASTR|nr:unnamed protein product [Lactuca virosa]
MASSSSSSVSLMASQTLILQKSTFLHPHRPSIVSLSKPKSIFSSKPVQLSLKNPKKPLIIAPSSSSSSPTIAPNPPTEPLLTGPTRTITTLFAIALTASKVFAQKIATFALNLNLQQNVLPLTGPLFFATMSGRPARLHTPLTVVAAGMAKWLDIYSGVLLVRCWVFWAEFSRAARWGSKRHKLQNRCAKLRKWVWHLFNSIMKCRHFLIDV